LVMVNFGNWLHHHTYSMVVAKILPDNYVFSAITSSPIAMQSITMSVSAYISLSVCSHISETT